MLGVGGARGRKESKFRVVLVKSKTRSGKREIVNKILQGSGQLWARHYFLEKDLEILWIKTQAPISLFRSHRSMLNRVEGTAGQCPEACKGSSYFWSSQNDICILHVSQKGLPHLSTNEEDNICDRT